MKLDIGFYKGKTILISGHTGFKGSWLSKILINAGANVIGYSLSSPTEPNLCALSGNEKNIASVIGDIRDYDKLLLTFKKHQPEIVFHLAAQPIVRESYKEPRYTYETNVMGTVNVMECARNTSSVKSVINVTTDKVYLNNDEYGHSFKEDDPLDGYDPYSNSKSCSELVTHAYKKSFFNDMDVAVSTARAGNVIGGGDFSVDRIIPDAVRAIEKKKDIIVRNPNSIRPYQFVLEPLYLYLLIAEEQYKDKKYQGYYNVGPDEIDCVTTGQLMDMFCKTWGNGAKWHAASINGPHEAGYLKLDCSKARKVFGWKPRTHINDAIDYVCEWTKTYLNDKSSIPQLMDREITRFFSQNGK